MNLLEASPQRPQREKKVISKVSSGAVYYLNLLTERGQGIMEYVILTSFIGLFCLVAMKQLGGVLEKRVQSIKTQLVEHMKIR